jgi:hypothetical protein
MPCLLKNLESEAEEGCQTSGQSLQNKFPPDKREKEQEVGRNKYQDWSLHVKKSWATSTK